MQNEGYKGLTGLKREKPCENDKKLMLSLVRFGEREREKFEELLKSEFEQVKISF